MIHEEERILISQYVDGELDLSAEQKLFGHLTECEKCREFLRHSLMLRSDMTAVPFRLPEMGELGRSGMPTARSSNISDKGPISSSVRRLRRRTSISTFVLLAMVTLILGVLLSANIRVQRAPDPSVQEKVQMH
jgi:anti-sigma factor RsiW